MASAVPLPLQSWLKHLLSYMYFDRFRASEASVESTVTAGLPLAARHWLMRVSILSSSVEENEYGAHAADTRPGSETTSTRAAMIAREAAEPVPPNRRPNEVRCFMDSVSASDDGQPTRAQVPGGPVRWSRERAN